MGANGRGANGRAAAERRGTGGWDTVLEAERTLAARLRVALRALPRGGRPVPPRRRPARPRGGDPRAAARAAALARRELPGAARRRRGPVVHGLPRAAHADDGPDEGRLPLRPRRLAGRVRGARDVDDLQVRARRPAVRRRQGRRPLRPQPALRRRARARDAPLRLGDLPDHRPRPRHPGARHRHRRARDGVVHGHLLAAGGPPGARRSSPASRSSSAAPRGATSRPGSASSTASRS